VIRDAISSRSWTCSRSGTCTDDAPLTAALRQTQVPFAVSSVAQAAALASLEPAAEAQLMARVADVVAERRRVYAELVAMGYEVPPSEANFVWLPLGAATVDWAAGCEQRKVIVRAFGGSGARVTIGAPEENDSLLAAARELASAVLNAR
jgi:histidinol-phosphate aminotransferase